MEDDVLGSVFDSHSVNDNIQHETMSPSSTKRSRVFSNKY